MSRFQLSQISDLLWRQDGVVCRRQLIEHGAMPHDIARLVRRRELTPAISGVYLTHTGPPTPRQRQWIAVLAAWPAALAGPSALPEPKPGPVHLVVGAGRSPRVPPGTRVRRSNHIDDEVLWNRDPPRARIEHALIDMMSAKIASGDVADAFHVLTDVVFNRRTDVSRLLAALERRPRVRGRTLIRGLLHDLRDGACSVLEREYMHKVEGAHALPRADRQHVSRATGRESLLDVPYPEFGLVVELDGSAFHRGAQTDVDALRDLAELAVNRRPTLRITFGLVFDNPCRTAWLLAQVLQDRGWDGAHVPCHRCRRRTTAA